MLLGSKWKGAERWERCRVTFLRLTWRQLSPEFANKFVGFSSLLSIYYTNLMKRRQLVLSNSDLSYPTTHSQFLLAHQRLIRKMTAKTKVAILLASKSYPQAIRAAPMKELPKYPAGRVNQGIPPLILVAPPSSGSN